MVRTRCRPFLPAAAAALALLSACAGGSRDKPPPPAAPAARPPVPVRVARAERRTVPIELQALGTVEPLQTVSVRPRVNGQILSVEFREGQEVKTGDVLFRLDPRPFEVALAQEEAKIRRDQAQLAYARSEARRTRSLSEREYIARDLYDQARANLAGLEASVALGEASLAAARLNLEYATLSSPIDGRTGNLLVSAGNVVSAAADRSLVVIHQLRPIAVAFAVPEADLPRLRERQAAGVLPVTARPRGADTERTGELTFVDNAVDPGTGTVRVEATFPNTDAALWPGQFADVVLTLGEIPDAVVVPAVAVQDGQQGRFVVVVKADGTTEMRPVQVARSDAQLAVLAAGLGGGETVVTDGHLRLTPGARVVVETGAGSPGAAPGAPRPEPPDAAGSDAAPPRAAPPPADAGPFAPAADAGPPDAEAAAPDAEAAAPDAEAPPAR